MLGLRALILIMPPPDRAEALLSDDVSDVRRRLSVAYIGPKSRTERPMKSKIGPEVAHVTCDSEHHFQGQKVKGQLAGGGGILLRPPAVSGIRLPLIRSAQIFSHQRVPVIDFNTLQWPVLQTGIWKISNLKKCQKAMLFMARFFSFRGHTEQ